MNYGDTPAGPMSCAVAVTPSDSTDLPIRGRGLYVGMTGDVAVVFNNDAVVVFKNIAAGYTHPICNIKRINATNTTATQIVVGQ